MIQLLDCTLRDGGYVNDWNFGEKAIGEIYEKLNSSNVDIIELGFLKDDFPNDDRTVFNSIERVNSRFGPKEGVQYALMAEVINPLPLDCIPEHTKGTVDIMRVIVWKDKRNADGIRVDALEEGFKYCEGLSKKGYKVCINPARVEQYSDEEFIELLNRFQKINPYAIYIVDSWGTRSTESIKHYFHIADSILKPEIAIGLHCHNNKMQAFQIASDIIKFTNDNRDIIIDSSLFGIGRGAGNLHTEIIADYLNKTKQKKYKLEHLYDAIQENIEPIKQTAEWGYSIPLLLTANCGANPRWASYMSEKKMAYGDMVSLLSMLNNEDKVVFDANRADIIYEEMQR